MEGEEIGTLPTLLKYLDLLQVKKGKVYAVGTEDMDALTFGSNVLLRHLTFSEARKMPIKEFYHDKVRNRSMYHSCWLVDLT
jgi:hypothetical protein